MKVLLCALSCRLLALDPSIREEEFLKTEMFAKLTFSLQGNKYKIINCSFNHYYLVVIDCVQANLYGYFLFALLCKLKPARVFVKVND